MTRAAMWPVDPLVIFAIFWRIALPSYNGIIIISNYKGPVMNQSGFNGMSYVRGFVSVAHVSRWARSQNNFVPRLFHPVLCVVPNSAIASWLRASSFRPARHEKAPKQGDTWWIPMKMDQDRWRVTETLHVVFRCIQDNNFVCIRLPGDQLLFFWKKNTTTERRTRNRQIRQQISSTALIRKPPRPNWAWRILWLGRAFRLSLVGWFFSRSWQ